MLEPWSLQRSKWVKRLAALIYQRACLERAACIRATSRLEHDSIRQAGYRNRIAVIPNGVDLPDLPAHARIRNPKPPRVALFLSRIHPKKGLMNLLRAWASVQNPQPSTLNPQRFDWLLRIVGPDECNHLSELKVEAGRLGISNRVQFEGAVYGDARTRCYLDADLFVLPSWSENFGLVIAESLACRVPVITTRATPWADLESARCGWWIETGVDPLVAALRDAISKFPENLAEMGARGRRLIEEKYTWEPIGRRMLEVYEWAAGAGPKPDCLS
jgi:glycosyltransferase involved in cell wall biosynthesis